MVVGESDDSAAFVVTLSARSEHDVTVTYATSNATATAEQDYAGTRGTLIIAAGRRTGTVPVRLLDDEYPEGDETFTVTLSDPDGAVIADGVGTGTIIDDDRVEVTVSYGAGSYTVTEGSVVSVTVVLSEAAGRSVTIPLTRAPDGASASDYSGVPGRVRFGASETRRSFDVSAARDEERDAEERVVLGFGALPAGVAPAPPETSTITIVDRPPAGGRNRNDWLRRFGETATGHLLVALDQRVRCAPIRPSPTGRHGTPPFPRGCEPRVDRAPASLVIAGRRIPAPVESSTALGFTRPASGATGAPAHEDRAPEGRGSRATRSMGADEVLARSAFEILSRSQAGGGRFSLWGRGALSHFDDDHAGADLHGDVASATFGADYANHRALAGVAVLHSEGDGRYLEDGLDHAAHATVTGVYPYLFLKVNERDSMWGVAGLGSGALTATEDGVKSKTGVAARMGAVGARREILYPADNRGVGLALEADVSFLRIDSDESLDLRATENRTNRQRLAVEVSQEFTLDGGAWIAPFFEAGPRRDAGDAESALGLEIAGGFRYEYPALGLTAEFDARGLLRHRTDRFEETGVSGSLRFDPSVHSTLGPSVGLSLSAGVEGWNAPDGPWGQDFLHARRSGDGGPTGPRVDAGFGYGFSVLDGAGTATPWVGASLARRWHDWRIGYSLGFGSHVNLGIDGTLRHDAEGDDPSDYTVMLRLSIH